MRDLFYGLYPVSAKDIGLKPAVAAGEVADTQFCYKLAADWLPTAFPDEGLAADTRGLTRPDGRGPAPWAPTWPPQRRANASAVRERLPFSTQTNRTRGVGRDAVTGQAPQTAGPNTSAGARL
jgi:hypothetical protein